MSDPPKYRWRVVEARGVDSRMARRRTDPNDRTATVPADVFRRATARVFREMRGAFKALARWDELPAVTDACRAPDGACDGSCERRAISAAGTAAVASDPTRASSARRWRRSGSARP